MRERGLLDFGEQQLLTIQLLTERPNILRRYQDQFRHVLVDEFQDANMAQILLLELVGRGPDKPDNVVVVGDDDQSIYRFRGASYAAFDRSSATDSASRQCGRRIDRPATVVSQPLLENRRSTGHILSAASRLIGRNQQRLKNGALRPDQARWRRGQGRSCHGRTGRGGRHRGLDQATRSTRFRRRAAGATSRCCTGSTATAT